MNVEFALQEGIARIQELEAEINVKADWNMKAFERIEDMSADIAERQAQRVAYASEFGGDEGSIHEVIRKLKAAITRIDTACNDNHWVLTYKLRAAIKAAVELVEGKK